MFRALTIAVASSVAIGGCGVSQSGPSMGFDADTAKVILAVDVVNASCDMIMMGLGRREGAEYVGLRHVMVKGPGTNLLKPMVMNFGPGEYHITQISCGNRKDLTMIGRQETHLASISFKHSYASFRVAPHALHDIGLIRFHLTDGNKVKVDRVELPDETREAVRRQHPQDLPKIISSPAVIDPDTNPEKMIASVTPQAPLTFTTFQVRRR